MMMTVCARAIPACIHPRPCLSWSNNSVEKSKWNRLEAEYGLNGAFGVQRPPATGVIDARSAVMPPFSDLLAPTARWMGERTVRCGQTPQRAL